MSNMSGMEGFFQMGIFGGLTPMAEKTAKKSAKTATSSADKKKAATKTETKYKTPLKIVFDSLNTVEIAEAGELTKKEIFAKLAEMTGFNLFSEKESTFTFNKLKEGVFLVRLSLGAKYEKGTEGKKLLLEQIHNLDDIMQKEEGEIGAEDVKKYILENYGMDVTIFIVGDTYIPVPVLKKSDIEKIKLPVKITALTLFGEKLEVSEEEFQEFNNASEDTVTEEPKEGEEEEERENEEPVVSEKQIRQVLETFFPDYADDLDFGYDADKNILQVGHKTITSSSAAPAVKKEETYPTEGTTLSLLFSRIPLSPDMFKGEKEVTKKELIAYIIKDYPEYSMERTEVIYDKKKKLIMLLAKSGKRGAEYILENCKDYRREETPLMSITATKQRRNEDGCMDGLVYYNLPKIPFKLLNDIISYFMEIYRQKKTEAMAMVFFNKNTEEYETYIPKQRAGISEVEFERNQELELDPDRILAMEIHSHGIHHAFWSRIDNEEEISHRLYAVAGDMKSFKYDDSHLIVRAGTGGYHVKMPLSSVFEPFPDSKKAP